MLTDGVSRQMTEFPAKKSGLMVLFQDTHLVNLTGMLLTATKVNNMLQSIPVFIAY